METEETITVVSIIIYIYKLFKILFYNNVLVEATLETYVIILKDL